MQQFVSTCLAERSSVAGPICKIAFKTILRYGWAALIFLTLGLYFLFPASNSFEQIQEERKQPYELQATITGTAQLEKYMEIENIKVASPVITFQTTLTNGNFTLSSPVKAVSTDYLQMELIEGSMFHNQANMPFLILNSYAAKHFADEDEKEVSVQVNDSILISLNGTEEKAIICGIFEDDLETPIVYMSYYEAAKYFPKGETVDLLFLLTGKGAAEKAVQDLGRQRVNVTLDQNAIVRWELLQQQAVQYLITAMGFLACTVVLMKRRESDRLISEFQRLLLSGITGSQLKQIFNLRIIFTYGCCATTALLIALLSGLCSLTACISLPVILLLHYFFISD